MKIGRPASPKPPSGCNDLIPPLHQRRVLLPSSPTPILFLLTHSPASTTVRSGVNPAGRRKGTPRECRDGSGARREGGDGDGVRMTYIPLLHLHMWSRMYRSPSRCG